MVIPLCLNYLGIIHLDSHVIKEHVAEETLFTSIMGHLDLFSDVFFSFMPLVLILVCFLTYFNLIPKILDLFGQEQFLVDNDMTNIMVSDGEAFVNREKSKRNRHLESHNKQQRWKEAAQQRQALRTAAGENFGAVSSASTSASFNASSRSVVAPSRENLRSSKVSDDNSQMELLDPAEESGTSNDWDFLDFASKPRRPDLNNV